MPDQACCNARLGRILWVSAAVAVLAGCGSFDGASRRVANAITPYKMDMVQGNFVSREQVQALQPGMSRQQVREILGTPLVTSLFHGDRWEYVFTIKRPSSANGIAQAHRVLPGGYAGALRGRRDAL